MQHQLTNCCLRYHKIGQIPSNHQAIQMVKVPVPGSKVGASPWGRPGRRMLVLGIDSCTTALEVNIHKTIRRIECPRYCCGLKSNSTSWLSSSHFYGTEELQIFEVDLTLVFKEVPLLAILTRNISSKFPPDFLSICVQFLKKPDVTDLSKIDIL